VLRVVEDLVERAVLDDAARVHHGDAVRDVGDHAEVVGDQDHRGAGLRAQVAHLLEDLRLDRHVERRGGLVGNQDRRIAGECEGDHHALAHAARELERIVVDPLPRARDPDPLEQLDRALARLLVGHALVLLDLLDDLMSDPEHRVQRRHRVLEDHRDLGAAHPAKLILGGLDQLGALVVGAPLEARVRRTRQPHERHAGDRLARSRLPHHRQHLTRRDLEADPVDGLYDPLLGGERDAQVLDREQGLAVAH
jgi:hypothetical protein